MHVPEGATPKDGPSAGIAMVTAIISVMTGIPVRRDIAMTGEITLRGRVLPIGGLKEKLLAALRGGIKKVLIPEENAKDLMEIPDNVKSGLEIVPVSRMDEVLVHALTRHARADRMGRGEGRRGRQGGAPRGRGRRSGGVDGALTRGTRRNQGGAASAALEALARLPVRACREWCRNFKSAARAGRLAQLVEHLVYTERVGGSSPSPPTSRHFSQRRGLSRTCYGAACGMPPASPARA